MLDEQAEKLFAMTALNVPAKVRDWEALKRCGAPHVNTGAHGVLTGCWCVAAERLPLLRVSVQIYWRKWSQ